MAKRTSRQMRRARMENLEQRRLLSDVIPVGSEFLVASIGLTTRANGVAMDADGNFVIAGRGSVGINAVRYDAAGMQQGSAILVNTPATIVAQAAVGMDPEGHFVVAWRNRSEGLEGIVARRYDAQGMPQGEQFPVGNQAPFNFAAQYPSVAMDINGNFVIAWQSDREDGSGIDVYAQRFDADGVPRSDEFRVHTYTSGRQSNVDVAMDSDGDFVVVWSGGGEADSYGTYARRYDTQGVPQGSEFLVNTYTSGGQLWPSVGMDEDGDFVVAWHSTNGATFFSAYARRFDSNGVPQGPEFRVNSPATGDSGNVSVAMDADGNFVVAWASYTGLDGSGTGMFARRYDAASLPQGEQFQVNTYTTGNQGSPQSSAMDDEGDFVIVWMDRQRNGIYGQRYGVVPEVTASSFQFATAPHKLSFTFDRDVSGSLGTDDLVVQNLTTSQMIPSSDFSISYDPMTNIATFTYTGTTAGIAGMLPDGNCTATLIASGITTIQGAPLATDHVLNFRFLQGDANNDGRVNLEDFNILAANFGQSPRDFTQGDFDYDTIVNLNDFNILASRFGQVLAAAQARGSLFGRGPIEDKAEDQMDELV